MKPQTRPETPTDDLFRHRLENLIDTRHELVKLSELIDWDHFEIQWGATFCENGRPGIATRLIAGLHYLKHTYALSDEQVVRRWSENPYWQYFCGETYFQHELPLDPSSLTRWRQRLGDKGMESLLSATIDAAIQSKAVKSRHLKRVTVDSTVQEKAIAFPTDSRLYNRARERLVRLAKAHKRYEFGVKVSITTTNRSNLVVGAQSLPGRPYDGHTLGGALDQVTRLSGQRPERCYVDLGYRGHDVEDVVVFKARQKRGVTKSIRRELKRRNAIEPIIGHMKNDGLMHRNYLKGTQGDAINVILCGAGQNLRLILRHLRVFWRKIRPACICKPLLSLPRAA